MADAEQMPTLFHVLHVVGAVFVIGPMALVPMLGLRAIRRNDPAQLAGLARSALGLGIASLLVAALGFAVMSTGDAKDHWSFTTTWILWSTILYTVAVVIHLAVIVPVMRRASRPASDTPHLAGYRALAASSGVVGLLLVATVVLMVAQPG